jgi:hypothetical protein
MAKRPRKQQTVGHQLLAARFVRSLGPPFTLHSRDTVAYGPEDPAFRFKLGNATRVGAIDVCNFLIRPGCGKVAGVYNGQLANCDWQKRPKQAIAEIRRLEDARAPVRAAYALLFTVAKEVCMGVPVDLERTVVNLPMSDSRVQIRESASHRVICILDLYGDQIMAGLISLSGVTQHTVSLSEPRSIEHLRNLICLHFVKFMQESEHNLC